MDKTIRELTKVLQMDKRETKPYDTTAEVVRIEESTAWVHIPGGIDETPVQMTIDAKVGDVVQVRVSGGRAWITGNSSAPPTDDTIAKEARSKANSAEVIAVEASELSESAKTQAEAAARVAGNTSQHFWFTGTGLDTGAHITEKTEEEFISDPSNGGGNLLARSNGVAIRDGLDEIATFSLRYGEGLLTLQDKDACILGGYYDTNAGSAMTRYQVVVPNSSPRISSTFGMTARASQCYVDISANGGTNNIILLSADKIDILGDVDIGRSGDRQNDLKVSRDIYISGYKVVDYVIERGTSGNWKYIKWKSGRVECEGYYTFSSLTFVASGGGGMYRTDNPASFTIPSGIFSSAPTEAQGWIQSGTNSIYSSVVLGSLTTTGGKCQVWRSSSGTGTNISVHMRLVYRG